MSEIEKGRPKNTYPFPKTKEEKLKALLIHKAAKEKGERIPYFTGKVDPSDVHYFDNKGKGKFGLNDLNIKLKNEASRAALKKNLTPTLENYTNAWGMDQGKALYDQEQVALKGVYKKNNPLFQDVDHINSQADGGVHASRNLRSQDLSLNRSEGARKFPKFKQAFLGTNVSPQDYPKLHGPWPAEEMRNNIINGPDDPDEFAKYWVKKNNHSGNINYEGKGKKGNLGKLTKVAGALATAGALTPTQEAAAQAREEILQGNYTQAGLTIGTDLVKSQTTGQVVAQGTKLAAKVAQQKLGGLVGKNVIRHAIKLVGKSAAKKGLALATGPAAPAIIAGLVVMDVYVAADALSGGGLTQFFKNKANSLKIQGPKMDPVRAANSLQIMR
jgi:hypothetical protein|tara:strand:- start:139 stop:1296 length:1158 start_codon:yes stop_codon:yes gene_type:complete